MFVRVHVDGSRMSPPQPIDFISADRASVLECFRGPSTTMRKQRLYHFDVRTPYFKAGVHLAGPWRYTIATEPFNEGDPVPGRLVKIGSSSGVPGGTALGAIQVATVHASPNHAVIEFEAGHLTLIDLGNEPCTRLNGARISKCRVDRNDLLQLGAADITSAATEEHTTIRYVGFEDVTLGFGDNPHPFVERRPIDLTSNKPPVEIPNPFMRSPSPNLNHDEKPSPTMKKPRSHDRKPLQFTNPPSRERAPLSLTPHQLYHAIRLATQVGEATSQTRRPAMDALSSFLIGLNMQPADFLPKESAS